MEHLFNRSELHSESFRPVQTDVLSFTWSMKLRFADTAYHVANAQVVLMSWTFGVKSCTSWFEQHFELSGSNMFWKGVSCETLGTWPCHLATRDDAPEECRECRGTWSCQLTTARSALNWAVSPVNGLRLPHWMEHQFNCCRVDLTATAK